MSSENVLLRITGLTVEFISHSGTVTAVKDLDFQLFEKETLGIVGESGSGKSVTSLAVMGLVPDPPGKISKGSIVYKDKDLLRMKKRDLEALRGNEISMIFQEPMTSLNPILTCGFQIAESLRFHMNLNRKDAKSQAIQLLKDVGIPDAEKSIKRFPHELSGGMRQRVMIAMALACDPKVLIADEPTTALDVTIQAQILDLMNKLRKEKNTSIIMITHDLGVVSEVSDRIMVMYAGQCVETARTADLFNKPHHPYTKGLIATIPEIKKERTSLKEIPGMVPNPEEKHKGCPFHPRCTFVMDKCLEKEADLIRVNENHSVRCWLYGHEK